MQTGYVENDEEMAMSLHFSKMERNAQDEGRPVFIDGMEYLARLISAEIDLLESRRKLSVLIPDREIASESALRSWIQEQQPSELFMEAVNKMPYGGVYIGALMRRLSAPSIGYMIRLVSSEPFAVRFTYEPL